MRADDGADEHWEDEPRFSSRQVRGHAYTTMASGMVIGSGIAFVVDLADTRPLLAIVIAIMIGSIALAIARLSDVEKQIAALRKQYRTKK